MDDLAGASAAMLHVPQPPPYADHNQHTSSDRSSNSRGRGGRGGRGRGRGNRGGRGTGGRGNRDAHNAPAGEGSGAQAQQQQKRQRLQRPKVQMMPRALADLLEEPKIALMHRVVNLAGPDIAWKALMETLTIEEHGGLEVNAEACGRPAHMLQPNAQPRRRSKGGVFLTLLKTHVTKEVYKKIFEVEEELKKKRKKQVRQVRHQKMETKINGLALQDLWIGGDGEKKKVVEGDEADENEEGEIDETADVAMEEA